MITQTLKQTLKQEGFLIVRCRKCKKEFYRLLKQSNQENQKKICAICLNIKSE